MMSEDVSILIANHDSFEAIQLCIESIRQLTSYKNYRIVVYDDNSKNSVDLEYLRQAYSDGWIELIEGHCPKDARVVPLDRVNHPAIYWHGRSLNILINACVTRYAMVIDCDVQVKDGAWLGDLVSLIGNDKALGVAKATEKHMHPTDGYILPIYQDCFILLDMEKYRDGMQVDWIPHKKDRREEPFCSIFAEWYPPERIEYFHKHCDPKLFDRNAVYGDPGSSLWLKVQYDNPKDYYVAFIPEQAYKKHRHFTHASILGDECLDVSQPETRLAIPTFRWIKKELDKLRGVK